MSVVASTLFAPRILLVGICFFALVSCSGLAGEEELQTLFNAEEGPARGWSHIVSDPQGFPLIAREVGDYAVDATALTGDPELGGVPVFRAVLVRKLSDWGRQHANGIEPVFSDAPIRVEDLEAVRIRLKINWGESAIPDPSTLAAHYAGHLKAEEVAELDAGVACLGLTFLESGYNDQSEESLQASYYLRFDPAMDSDRWLEIELPLTDFAFGFEKNYGTRKVERKDVLGLEFVAFRINPEATGGKVARNFLADSWDGSVPELYKEVSISLQRIEAVVTPRAE